MRSANAADASVSNARATRLDLTAAGDAAIETIAIELAAMSMLARAIAQPPLRDAVCAAVEQMSRVAGRIVVTGVGKSGIVARKIAATLNSTGTPAHYMHGGDASHGDLGSVTRADLVLLLSWSGESAELSNIVSYCHRFAIPLIVVTGDANSAAARAANLCLALPHVPEARAGKLMPTSSTLVQLALGDALAMAMITIAARGISATDLGRFHPGGKLGARLRTVGDLMVSGEDMPSVGRGASIRDATVEMTGKRFGCTAVVDDDGALVGTFTDGDLRRCLGEATLGDAVALHMTGDPVTILPHELAADAVRLMNERRISTLFVCESGRLSGIVHLHDLLRAGVT